MFIKSSLNLYIYIQMIVAIADLDCLGRWTQNYERIYQLINKIKYQRIRSKLLPLEWLAF